jgi:transcriptional regulator with XRE-family HTH domain
VSLTPAQTQGRDLARADAERKWFLENMHDKAFRHGFMAEHIGESIARQIRDLRISRGLDQRQFAERCGAPQSVVSRWENPKKARTITIATLLKIATAMDVALLVRFVDWAMWIAFELQYRPDGFHVKSFSEDEIKQLLIPPHPDEGTTIQQGDNRG